MLVKKPFDKYALICFIVLSYLIHYLTLRITISLKLFLSIGYILAAWSPNISAIIVTGLIIKEKSGIRRLLGGWTIWRASFVWYLAAFIPLALGFMSTGIHFLAGGEMPGFGYSASAILMILWTTLITGATGEELGWRGFALPRLQSRFGALTSGIMVGLMWTGWHIPYWPIPGWFPKFQSIPFLAFALQNISKSVVMTWIYNKTGGSLLIVTLFHFVLNFSLFLGLWRNVMISTMIWVVFAVIVAIVLARAKPNVKRS